MNYKHTLHYLSILSILTANLYAQTSEESTQEETITNIQMGESLCLTRAQLKRMIIDDEDVREVNTSCITDMNSLFYGNETFNQDISGWDTSHVTDMSFLFFNAQKFNQSIGNWDTSKVEDMSYIFAGTKRFNQPLDQWKISNLITAEGMFYLYEDKEIFTSAFSTENYSNLLKSWSQQNVQNNVKLGLDDKNYYRSAKEARELLIQQHGWEIIDTGEIKENNAVPDYQATVNLSGSIISGASGKLDIIIRITERNNVSNSKGKLQFTIIKNPNLILSFEVNARIQQDEVVQNSLWKMTETRGLYFFTYSGNEGHFPAQGLSRIGLKGIFTSPKASLGKFGFDVGIISGKTGETDQSNNNDTEYIQYRNI